MKNCFGPFAEAFPTFLKLLEQLEARRALGELAIDFGKFALSFAELAGECRDCLLGGHRFAVRAGFFTQGLFRTRVEFGDLLRGGGLLLADGFDFLGKRIVPMRAGLLIHLVTRAIRAQSRYDALKLEELEFRLLEVLLNLREFAFNDRELTVALLEDGVAAAEKAELVLFILRGGVALGGDFAQLHLEFAEIAAGRTEAILEAGTTDVREIGGVFGGFFLRAHVVNSLLGVLHALVETTAQTLLLFERDFLFFATGATAISFGTQGGDIGFERAERGGELGVMKTAPGEAEVAQAMVESLVTHGLSRLTTKTANLAPDFADHIRHAGEILIGQRELAHSFTPLTLVLGDAGSFFENGAALLGLRRENLVNLALSHDRVASPADAGIHEKFLNVLQAAGLPVERVFALAVAVDAAGDFDFVKFAAKLFFAVREEQRNLAQLGGLASVGAFEDDVLHLAAAQGFRALLTEHPADGVCDVGFAAAVGTHHGRHTGFETEGRGVSEGLEAVQF